MKKLKNLLSVLMIPLLMLLFLSGCGEKKNQMVIVTGNDYIASVNDVPEYTNEPYVVIRDNIPQFEEYMLVTNAYEKYSELDSYGRCGIAVACIGIQLMPTEDRGSIGQVKPAGWHTVKYECVDGKYLYNRCHLIGFQLTGENANEKNLITGTRYLNVEGMLPFENMVADYIKESGNHVIYRVTPVYDGINLLARGVQIEAQSVEDDGAGVCFNIYAYNVQPQIMINYADGDSKINDGVPFPEKTNPTKIAYVLNTSSMKFHTMECSGGKKIKEENKKVMVATRQEVLDKGYLPCGICNP